MYKVTYVLKSQVEIGLGLIITVNVSGRPRTERAQARAGSGLIFWARSKLYYTAAHRFVIVIMALDGVFMRFDVKDNFFENDAVCTMLFLKTEGGKYSFL